ncbi:MAG: RNA polymerase sigma factor [Gemmatimonadaceae bacterium]
MDIPLPTLISSDRTFQPRINAMEQTELERELVLVHSESWGWSLACCGRDRELAEEVLQTVYLRIVSGRAKFGGESSFKTWVFGVIRWTARSELRRRRLSWSRRADSGAAIELADPGIGADVAAEDSDRRDALLAALAALSRRQKEVLQLVFYHDMTIEEAARVMKISLGSARTHYDRGKKALAGKLRRESGA